MTFFTPYASGLSDQGPQYDKRFYGIYEGTCTDNADPEGKFKIKLQVPQVLGTNETNWASPCLPVTSNANHPDHLDHTAAQVAALLTTVPVTITGTVTGTSATGGAVTGTSTDTVPALTVVPVTYPGTLAHPHGAVTDPLDIDIANAQHTQHRKVPNIGQKVWVMFIAGDPNFPVWLGVEL